MSKQYLDKSGLTYFWGKITNALSGKQATLVSGTNIKTINNESILGSGNITVSGGGVSNPKPLPLSVTPADPGLDPAKGEVTIGHLASGTYIVDKSLYPDLANDPNSEVYLLYSAGNPMGLPRDSSILLTEGTIIFVNRVGNVSEDYYAAMSDYEVGDKFLIIDSNDIFKYNLTGKISTGSNRWRFDWDIVSVFNTLSNLSTLS